MGVATQTALSAAVADEIRVALARKRMSAAGLARALGVSQTYVWRRLEGQTSFDLNDLEKISDIVGVPIVQLLTAATDSVSRDLNPRLSRPGRKDDPKPVRHVAPRRFGPPRRDPNGPPSATPLSSRRPRDTRPVKRPMAVAS
ncbi:MAG TPA: helix-turn-helix transcriptional regulator [Pseudonocardiaceae bacterium]